MRLLSRFVVFALAAIGLVTLLAGGFLLAGGISAQPEPGRAETAMGRRLRAWLIPASARDGRNPVPGDATAIEDGMRHFADHCAVCHANSGSGRTELGENLYPRAPDLRASPTQSLTDGSLFYIIEEGVRLTGMPGWRTGTEDGARASWRLVHFIRHLPRLTEEEERRMETMNPKTADEWRQETEEREFLEGGDHGDHRSSARPPQGHFE